MAEIIVEVRCRGMWLLVLAANIPSLSTFKLVSRLVRFEFRTPPGRWRLAATAYDLIDWDHWDDGDDGGRPIPTRLMEMAGYA